jgi:hypothetical protein
MDDWAGIREPVGSREVDGEPVGGIFINVSRYPVSDSVVNESVVQVDHSSRVASDSLVSASVRPFGQTAQRDADKRIQDWSIHTSQLRHGAPGDWASKPSGDNPCGDNPIGDVKVEEPPDEAGDSSSGGMDVEDPQAESAVTSTKESEDMSKLRAKLQSELDAARRDARNNNNEGDAWINMREPAGSRGVDGELVEGLSICVAKHYSEAGSPVSRSCSSDRTWSSDASRVDRIVAQVRKRNDLNYERSCQVRAESALSRKRSKLSPITSSDIDVDTKRCETYQQDNTDPEKGTSSRSDGLDPGGGGVEGGAGGGDGGGVASDGDGAGASGIGDGGGGRSPLISEGMVISVSVAVRFCVRLSLK